VTARTAVAAGLVVGAALVAVIAVTTEPPGRPPGGSHAATVEQFLAAERRSLSGTWVVTYRFERDRVDGRTTQATVVVAQRPPDRLRRASGTIQGRLGGRLVACTPAPDPSAPANCRDAGTAPPYDEDVEAQVAGLEKAVGGPQPLYGVQGEGGGCWHLVLRARVLAPPYGEEAHFCFDAPSGAPVRMVVQRPEGLDVTAALQLERRVAEADLAIPPVAGS
jgi:hypothetical protein